MNAQMHQMKLAVTMVLSFTGLKLTFCITLKRVNHLLGKNYTLLSLYFGNKEKTSELISKLSTDHND